MNQFKKVLPLTESMYYILLSLVYPLHGYGIIQNIKQITDNRLIIAPGTLYGALNTLIDKNFIKHYSFQSNKKEYIITDLGLKVLNKEIARLYELYSNGIDIIGGYC